ncbi:MAG: efflux RND transporter periplasmic adaptor subunit [Syntrophales bacterium]|nr:efflux RND transporter periplasmic adaptor subunit [Syntrophales bacterium]
MNNKNGMKLGRFTWKWVFAGVMSVLVMLLVAYTVLQVSHTFPDQARKTGKPLPVELCRADVRDLSVAVGASSISVPYHEIHIRSEVPGTIREIPVKIGDVVAPQTLLLRLDDKEYRASLNRAAALVASTGEQLRVSRLNFDRYQSLYKQKLIALSELEKYQVALASAKEAHALALKDQAWAKRQLKATNIYSGIHGVLSAQQAHVGEYVDRNTPLLDLGQITPILVEAKVPEEKLTAVNLGQEAKVSFDTFPGQLFTGQIFKIDPRTDPNTRVFPAYIKLENPDQKLRLGLTGYTRMETQIKGLSIPSIAVINLFADPVLFVVKEDRVQLRRITPGGVAAGYTWIKDGLTKGDQVVVAGQRYLKEGDKVQVLRQ